MLGFYEGCEIPNDFLDELSFPPHTTSKGQLVTSSSLLSNHTQRHHIFEYILSTYCQAVALE
jgi:hypothetical protein